MVLFFEKYPKVQKEKKKSVIVILGRMYGVLLSGRH